MRWRNKAAPRVGTLPTVEVQVVACRPRELFPSVDRQPNDLTVLTIPGQPTKVRVSRVYNLLVYRTFPPFHQKNKRVWLEMVPNFELYALHNLWGLFCLLNIADPRIGTHHLELDAFRSPMSNDFHNLEISTPRNKKAPDARASLDFGRSGIKKMSKRNIPVRTVWYASLCVFSYRKRPFSRVDGVLWTAPARHLRPIM